MDDARDQPTTATRTVAGLDAVTWLGVAMATIVGAWLRLAETGAHLPQLVEPDEPTTVVRALGVLDGSFAPPIWDWPPGGAILDALVLRTAAVVGIDTLGDAGTRYLVSRVAFGLLGLLVVPAAAVLAGRLSEEGRSRRVAAIGTAAALAISFLLVRFGRQVHPDPLQSLFVVLAVLATLRARSTEDRRWFWAAGVCAGLAAAMKFIGGLIVIPVAIAALVWTRGARARVPEIVCASGRRCPRSALGLRHLRARTVAVGGVTVGSMVAFVLATGGSAVTDLGGMIDGLTFQFDYQATPRLGYEGSEAVVPWLFGQVLPGSLGWPLVVLSLVGLGWLAARGRPGDRFVVGAAIVLLAYPLVTSVRFPHYVLPALPLLVVAGMVLLGRLLADVRVAVVASGALIGTAVIAGSWLPLSGDLGLLTAARSTDTRELATAWIAEQERRTIVAEKYTLASQPDLYVGFVPPEPLDDCRCWYLVSSYNTDRYERMPEVYADAIAAHRRWRDEPSVTEVRVFRPDVPLDYRWNLLPQWGVGGLALRDGVMTGPTVTIFRVEVER